MGSIHIEKFGGRLPSWDDRFIPEDQASFSRDTYLYSGAAIGWRKPKLLRSLTNSAAKYAYRIPTITQGIASDSLTFISNPNVNDTVTVGEITYKFVNTPANPFDVLRASSAALSAEALLMAITYGSYDTNIVGANTPVDAAVTGSLPVIGFSYPFQGTTNTPGANTVVLIPVTAAVTMNLNSVNLMPGASSGAAKFTGVVYSNVNLLNTAGSAYVNTPATLISTGSEVVGCTSGTPVTSTFSVPVTIQSGQTYWIGFIMDTAIPLALSSTNTQAVSNSNPYSNGPPNPFQTTNLSGVIVNGVTTGSLQTPYNVNQPNWQIWGALSVINSTDALNTISGQTINLQAPAFGTAFNSIPVAESTGGTRLSWSSSVFTGGANQSSDTTITGASTWLEFLDQDTNVLRTPVVDDIFQRYYFAGPSVPPQYNTLPRITNGQPAFYLGVPAPPIAPSITTVGGGLPTTIGFPNSIAGSGTFSPANASINLFLYPVQTSVDVALNSIGVNFSNPGSGGQNFTAYLFANSSNNTAGDLIASVISSTVTSSGSFFATFSSPQVLTANTTYWIGVDLLIGTGGGITPFTASLADSNRLGYLYNAPIGSGFTLPTDPATNMPMAPTMMPNAVDLQVWGVLGPTGTVTETSLLETRAYVYTWVTAYGEEGPPSPPLLLTDPVNATWNITLQPPLAEDMGTLRNITNVNIYRTIPSQQGGTVFFLVGSVPVSTTLFADNYSDDVVAANLILPSTTWFGPPATLQGIVAMPNGFFAGFRSNEVWFSEPFRPHAWPAQYVMTTDFPIIGLGVVGTTLVACTDTSPQTFTGVNPSVMSQTRIPMPEPCTSRGSIMSTENGVYYTSANGLIKVAGGGAAANVTQNWITREKWDQNTPQKFVRAAKNVSTYYAFGTTGVTNGSLDSSVAQQGFTLELSEADKNSFTLWPQVGGHRIGFSTLSSPVGLNIDNVLYDPWSGVVILIAGGSIYYFDFPDQAPTITPYLWRSKKFQGPRRENFAAFRLWFDIPPGGPQTPPVNRTTVPFQEHPGTAAQMTFVPGMFGIVRVIADGLYITEREIRTSEELMRVAAAQKYTTWQIEIEGVVSVTNVKMATTVKELGLMK